jgi:hypothetical protein
MDLQSDQRRQINRTSRNARDRLQEKLVDVMRTAPLSDAQLMFEAVRLDSVPAQLETLADQLLSKANDVSDTNGFEHDGAFQMDESQISDIADDNDQDLAESELSYTAVADSCEHSDGDLPWACSASPWPAVNLHFDQEQIFQAMLSFIELARSQIVTGMNPLIALSMTGLELDLFFRDRMTSDFHTVSTWACEFVKSYSAVDLSPATRFALVYIAGGLMRWLTLPCLPTYELMPKILQVIPKGSMDHSHTHIDRCRIHGLQWLISVMQSKRTLLWSYDYTVCLSPPTEMHPRHLANYFTDHCDEMKNWDGVPETRSLLPTSSGRS